MNQIREKEAKENLTFRQLHERHSVQEKPDAHKYLYKNTCKKSVGEYFATTEDKINLLKYLADHPTMPEPDKKYIKNFLK
jgi:hypothetical protein